MDELRPGPDDHWAPYVRPVFWLARAVIWVGRLMWRLLYWTVMVAVAFSVMTWGAFEEPLRELGVTLRNGVRSPLALPANLAAFYGRRRRTRAARRRSSVLAFGSTPNVVGIIHELRNLPEEDVSPSALVSAAFGASRLGDPRAGPYVLPLLEHPDEHVRWAATEALGGCTFRDGEAALIALLEDQSALVRMSAARALGKIGARDAGDVLRRAARDSDEGVRLYATQALLQLHDPLSTVDLQLQLRQALARPWWRRKRRFSEYWRSLAAGESFESS